MKRRFNIFAGLAACTSLTGFAHLCYAQCDTSAQSGDIATTDGWEHNVDLDYDGDPDPDTNGGCNLGAPTFTDLGSLTAGAIVRVTGVTGNYEPMGGGNSRDLDWCSFNLAEPGYINVRLAMAKDGVPFSSSNGGPRSALFIAQGPAIADNTAYCNDAATVFIYGEYLDGDCPQIAVYTFPNAETASKIPMPAGRHMVIVSTPFNPTGTTIYNGPIDYALTMEVSPLDNAVCGTSTTACTEVHSSGGCNDAACCDVVCGLEPNCCTVAWDQACVDKGVNQCGLFVYSCVKGAGSPENDCVGAATFIDAGVLPLTFGFDATNASNDGPNDVTRLCESKTTKDVWYVVGPMAYNGELLTSMCGLGNSGDAVMEVYDLGTESTVTDPSMLPEMFIGCRDDSCFKDDGTLDYGGPAAINFVGAVQGNYYAVRVGTFLAPGVDPSTPAGLIGSLTMSFRANVFSNGWTRRFSDNSGTGWVSGFSTTAGARRWMAVPFFTTDSATINGFDFAGWDSDGSANTVNFKIFARDTQAADHPGIARPFGNGVFNASQVLFEGSEPWDGGAYASLADDVGDRYFVELSTPFDLSPGDYYFTLYGSNTSGSNAMLVWAAFPTNGVTAPKLTSTANIGVDPTADAVGLGKPYAWRSSGTAGTFCAYAIKSCTDVAPLDVDSMFIYQAGLNVKGKLANACFGDIDGSGVVDNGDVAFALLDYGVCPGCPSDLDGSGEVDFGDIALILLSTGPCF